jgi:hypothetical protein
LGAALAVLAMLAVLLAMANSQEVTSVTLLNYSFSLFEKDPYAFSVRAMAASIPDDELDYLGPVILAEMNGEDWSGDVVLAKASNGYSLMFFNQGNRPSATGGDVITLSYDPDQASVYQSNESPWLKADPSYEFSDILLSTFDIYEAQSLIKARQEFSPWHSCYLMAREASQVFFYRMFRGILGNQSWMKMTSWYISTTIAATLGLLLLIALQKLSSSPEAPKFKKRLFIGFGLSAVSGFSLHLYGHLPTLYHYDLFGLFKFMPLAGLCSLAGSMIALVFSGFTDNPKKSLGIAAFAILAGYISGYAMGFLLVLIYIAIALVALFWLVVIIVVIFDAVRGIDKSPNAQSN